MALRAAASLLLGLAVFHAVPGAAQISVRTDRRGEAWTGTPRPRVLPAAVRAPTLAPAVTPPPKPSSPPLARSSASSARVADAAARRALDTLQPLCQGSGESDEALCVDGAAGDACRGRARWLRQTAPHACAAATSLLWERRGGLLDRYASTISRENDVSNGSMLVDAQGEARRLGPQSYAVRRALQTPPECREAGALAQAQEGSRELLGAAARCAMFAARAAAAAVALIPDADVEAVEVDANGGTHPLSRHHLASQVHAQESIATVEVLADGSSSTHQSDGLARSATPGRQLLSTDTARQSATLAASPIVTPTVTASATATVTASATPTVTASATFEVSPTAPPSMLQPRAQRWEAFQRLREQMQSYRKNRGHPSTAPSPTPTLAAPTMVVASILLPTPTPPPTDGAFLAALKVAAMSWTSACRASRSDTSSDDARTVRRRVPPATPTPTLPPARFDPTNMASRTAAERRAAEAAARAAEAAARAAAAAAAAQHGALAASGLLGNEWAGAAACRRLQRGCASGPLAALVGAADTTVPAPLRAVKLNHPTNEAGRAVLCEALHQASPQGSGPRMRRSTTTGQSHITADGLLRLMQQDSRHAASK